MTSFADYCGDPNDASTILWEETAHPPPRMNRLLRVTGRGPYADVLTSPDLPPGSAITFYGSDFAIKQFGEAASSRAMAASTTSVRDTRPNRIASANPTASSSPSGIITKRVHTLPHRDCAPFSRQTRHRGRERQRQRQRQRQQSELTIETKQAYVEYRKTTLLGQTSKETAAMPMLDAFIPDGALSPDAEKDLFATLTEILIRTEGGDPTNADVRSIAWVTVHRPTQVYVAGEPATEPRYRFIASVPEGQYDPERREALVAEVTEAVLAAENGAHRRNPMRVWVFAHEIPDGTWGGNGQINTLADIAGFAIGNPQLGREYAERRLAKRRGTAVSS